MNKFAFYGREGYFDLRTLSIFGKTLKLESVFEKMGIKSYAHKAKTGHSSTVSPDGKIVSLLCVENEFILYLFMKGKTESLTFNNEEFSFNSIEKYYFG